MVNSVSPITRTEALERRQWEDAGEFITEARALEQAGDPMIQPVQPHVART